MDGARRFEGLPEATKDLCESCLVSGIVGRDRGGVSVAYGKPLAGDDRVVSETSFETFVAFQEHLAIFYWGSLYRNGVQAGELPARRIQMFGLNIDSTECAGTLRLVSVTSPACEFSGNLKFKT